MKPYLAILIDSFWEAVTSKVLWALLIGWSILLAGLAPFGYVIESSYELPRGDVRNQLGLAQKMAKGLTSQGTATQKAISERLSPEIKSRFEEAAGKADRDLRLQKIGRRDLVTELNNLLKDPDLYDPESFPTAAAREQLKPVLGMAKEKRTADDVAMLNRTLIQIAYSADLAAPRSEQLWIGYAGLKLGQPLPLNRRQVNSIVERIALEIIIRLGLSFVTVFVGLIVTSPMIPDTFKSGSLHLLLSKPVSRALIYLTKFFGGTVFVLVNIAYFLTGLFLLVGWRLGIWNAGLLWCIPLLLFVFVIFYSVSALVGLIWNNPIICVVVCIVFWIFCLVVGTLESSLRIPAQWAPQIMRIHDFDNNIVSVTQSGALNVWNEEFRVWQPVAENQTASGRVLGPIYDDKRQRLIMRSDFQDGVGGFQTNSRKLVYADLKPPRKSASAKKPDSATKPDSTTKPADSTAKDAGAAEDVDKPQPPVETTLVDEKDSTADSDISKPKNVEEARRKQRWPSENGVEPPMLMIDLLAFGEKTLAVTRNGIFELDWAVQDALDEASATKGILGSLLSSFTARLQPESFKELSPTDYPFGDNIRVAKSADDAWLLIYNNGKVDALHLDDSNGKFKVENTWQLDGEEKQSGLIAVSSGHCVVARERLPLTIISRKFSQESGQSNTATRSVNVPGGSDVRQLFPIAGSDRVSIVTHSGHWLVLDAGSGEIKRVACSWQGSITGATWVSDDVAWIGIKPNRAVRFNAATGSIEKSLDPTPSRLDFFYNWIARPLYLVNPKPSSLNGVLSSLLSRESAGQTQLINNDLAAARVDVEIWQPIISNLIFVSVLLLIGCIYVWRREY